MKTRPNFLSHWSNHIDTKPGHYPGSDEMLSRGAPLAKALGLKRLGIHWEILEAGRRSSWPHAESTEEEGFLVLSGSPDLWLNGELYPLQPGDCGVFPPGSGEAHVVVNNSNSAATLLVFGESSRADNQVHYPLHPQRNQEVGDFHWNSCPPQRLGNAPAEARESKAQATDSPLLVELPFPITTPRLRIQPRFKNEGRFIFEAVTDSYAELSPWMDWVSAKTTVHDMEIHCRESIAKFHLREDITLSLYDREGTFVGSTGLHRINWKLRSFEIGYWVRSTHAGQGYISEAVNALSRYAFGQLNAKRVEIRCDSNNQKSLQVAERLCFQREAKLLNERLRVDGQLSDTLIYSLTSVDALPELICSW